MDEMGNINWDAIFPDLEERWQAWERARREKALKELAQPVQRDDWTLVCRLVRLKKGRWMDGEAVEFYLKDFFEVPDLRWITREEVQSAIRYLFELPDRE